MRSSRKRKSRQLRLVDPNETEGSSCAPPRKTKKSTTNCNNSSNDETDENLLLENIETNKSGTKNTNTNNNKLLKKKKAYRMMTPNGVRKLLLAEDYTEPVVIGLVKTHASSSSSSTTDSDGNNKYALGFHLFDTELQTPVLVARDACDDFFAARSSTNNTNNQHDHWLVQIQGYITSTVNATATSNPAFQPFLCITSLLLVARLETSCYHSPATLNAPANTNTTMTPARKPQSDNKLKVQGGTSAAGIKMFLEQFDYTTKSSDSASFQSALLDYKYRLDLQPCITLRPSHERTYEQNRTMVQDFYHHHKAMQTLLDSNPLLHPYSRSNSIDLTHAHSQIADEAVGAMESDASTTQDDTTTPTTDLTYLEEPRSAMKAGQTEQKPMQTPQSQQLPPQHELYFAALEEFIESQIDRQKASLTSNAGKASSKVAAQVVEQYKDTHDDIMCTVMGVMEGSHHRRRRHLFTRNCTFVQDWVTSNAIRRWHDALCGNGLTEHPGRFRTKTVKAGRTVFRPADKVMQDLQDDLFPAFALLEEQLTRHLATSREQEAATAAMTLGAAVFFGLVDVHPFADGNGRLARLLGNGALRAVGLPFCINWFATSAQRREYVLATLMTRRNLTLVYRGVNMDDTAKNEQMIRDAMEAAGLYFPLVALLMDRVRKAIDEFVQLQHYKQLSQMEHEECKAARRVRERAAAGSCLICFDDNPNIATLCCGKAVHLNCIAEWLSNNMTCPNCRETLPKVQTRPESSSIDQYMESQMQSAIARAVQLQEDEELDEDDSTSIIEDDIGSDTTDLSEDGVFHYRETVEQAARDMEVIQAAVELAGRELQRNRRAADESDDNDSTDNTGAYAQGAEEEVYEEESGNSEEPETDIHRPGLRREPFVDTTDEDDGSNSGQESLHNVDANDSLTDGGSTVSVQSSDNHQNVDNATLSVAHCYHCRNRAAQECINSCCGRCCIIHGVWECHRHSG